MGAVVDPADYFGLGGWLLNVDMAVFVVAVTMAVPPPAVVARVVGWGPLAVAGRYSLVLYIWHYPLFWYLSQNETDWGWRTRTFVAYAATLAIALVAQVVIERTTQRWLRSEKWRALDRGIGPGLLALAGRGRDAAWARLRGREPEQPGTHETASAGADERPAG
jgi:peptidoglycan/LPS O-acetylase OafA/YrhL